MVPVMNSRIQPRWVSPLPEWQTSGFGVLIIRAETAGPRWSYFEAGIVESLAAEEEAIRQLPWTVAAAYGSEEQVLVGVKPYFVTGPHPVCRNATACIPCQEGDVVEIVLSDVDGAEGRVEYRVPSFPDGVRYIAVDQLLRVREAGGPSVIVHGLRRGSHGQLVVEDRGTIEVFSIDDHPDWSVAAGQGFGSLTVKTPGFRDFQTTVDVKGWADPVEVTVVYTKG